MLGSLVVSTYFRKLTAESGHSPNLTEGSKGDGSCLAGACIFKEDDKRWLTSDNSF